MPHIPPPSPGSYQPLWWLWETSIAIQGFKLHPVAHPWWLYKKYTYSDPQSVYYLTIINHFSISLSLIFIILFHFHFVINSSWNYLPEQVTHFLWCNHQLETIKLSLTRPGQNSVKQKAKWFGSTKLWTFKANRLFYFFVNQLI